MDARRFSFKNDRGQELYGIVEGGGERGVVFCTHFTGSKEVGHYYRLSKAVAKAGLCSIRFDYGDCIGESEGTCWDMSLSNQVKDTISAIDYMGSLGVVSVGLFGHSLGGSTAIAAAAKDERVRALVTAAPMARLDWGPAFKGMEKDWKERGYATFYSWKRGEIRIGHEFYRDLQNYDATVLVRDIRAPLLIVHPADDKLLGIENSFNIYNSANQPKRLEIIGGADHMFGSPVSEERLTSMAVDWFVRWL